MKVLKRNFSSDIQEGVELVKQEVKNKYDLNPGNNVNLICEKLMKLQSVSGAYVECGVFQGNTFFSVGTFLRQQSSNRTLLGLDTFEGFPEHVIDDRDRPLFFDELLKRKLITIDHYEKARQRTKDFTEESHLSKEYFLDINKVFDIAKDFDNVQLIKGAFKDTLKTIKQPVAVLYLDCDLYLSYWECLTALYPQVVSGGVIIFDECYSLKYPGPRLAVNEFFEDKVGYFEQYLTNDVFERWCFIKD